MRIANISSVYPPRYVGGYELGCADVVQRLVERKHTVCVLTSQGPENRIYESKIDEPEYVNRCLPLVTWGDVDPEQLRKEELSIRLHWRASRIAKHALQRFNPDITIIWCVARLPKSIIFQTCRNFRTGFYISDHWLAKSEKRPLFDFIQQNQNGFCDRVKASVLQRLAGSSYHDLDLRRVIFASEHLKTEALEKNFAVDNSEVIRWGIERSKYVCNNPVSGGENLEIVYAGQLSRHKGPETLIKSIKNLLDNDADIRIRLTLFGGATGVGAEAYLDSLRRLADPWESGGKIVFAGKVSREDLVARLPLYDVFVLPSEWDEPFSISLLEAMSSGLAIVATSTGGTIEILNETNALLYEPGDVEQLKQRILLLLRSPRKVQRLRAEALRSISPFTLDRMVDNFEEVVNCW